MSKYDVLTKHLKGSGRERLSVSFAQIEVVLGTNLPASAYSHPAWWANDPSTHVQARSWMNAGYETEVVDVANRTLVFRRIGQAPTETSDGMNDGPEAWRGPPKKIDRHPAFGALKGMMTIEPGYDIAASDPEIVAEWEAAIERRAALAETGLKRKP